MLQVSNLSLKFNTRVLFEDVKSHKCCFQIILYRCFLSTRKPWNQVSSHGRGLERLDPSREQSVFKFLPKGYLSIRT